MKTFKIVNPMRIALNYFALMVAVAAGLGVAPASRASITFDAASSASQGTGATIEWSHAVGTGTDRMLVVGITTESNPDVTVTGAAFGAQALAPVAGARTFNGATPANASDLWYLPAPAEGTNTISVTFSGTVSAGTVAGAVSLFGVVQGPPEAVTNYSAVAGSTYSASLPPLTDGAWLVDAVNSGSAGATFTPGPGQTRRWYSGGSQHAGASSTRETRLTTPASTATDTWTTSGTSRRALSVAAFAPVTPPHPAADILVFDFGTYGPATISGTSISVGVPLGTNVTALTPTYTTSYGATCPPGFGSGDLQDFSSGSVHYLVTSADSLVIQDYIVTVNFQPKAVGVKYVRGDALSASEVAGAGAYARFNWNMAAATGQGPPVTPINALKDNTGAPTGVAVSTWTQTTGNSWSLGDTGSANAKLINSFSDQQPSISVAGLDVAFPGGYDVVVYYSNNEGPTVSTLTLTGTVNDHVTRSIRTGPTGSCSYSSVGFVRELGVVQPATSSTNHTVFTSLNDAGFSVAMTGGGNNGICAIQIVEESGPPTVPSTPVPADLATNILTSTNLAWRDSSRTTGYQVFLWQEGDAEPGTPTATPTLSVFTPPGGLAYATTYYWRVIAVGDAGTSDGPLWSFTTAANLAPDPVSNPAPAETAANVALNTSLGWGSAARAASYNCYLWKSTEAKPAPPTAVTTTPGFVPAANLEAGTIYQWQVDSVNGSGTTAGPLWSFTTGFVPEAPTSPTPADAATVVPSILVFDWAAASGASSYQIFVWPDGDSEPATPTAVTTASELLPTTLLVPSTLYHWRVKAINSFGPTNGPVWNFTTSSVATSQVSIGWNYDGLGDDTLAASDLAGAPPYAQVSWNNHPGIGQGPGTVPFALYNNSGAASGASVTAWTLAINNSWSQGQSANPNQKLLNSFADQQPSITFSNLPASYVSAGYSVVVYYTNNEGPSTSTLTLTGSFDDSVGRSIRTGNTALSSYGTVGFVQETGALAGPTNHTVFTGLNDPEFTVAMTGSNNNGISAIQLIRGPYTASPYDTWAATNAGGQAANLDYNSDGVPNGVAYFMGMTGLATHSGVVAGKVTWPRDPAAVATFMVQVSDNLSAWTDILPPDPSIDETNPNQVTYTLPGGDARKFCRLVVITP
ncbi:MAG: hypothetical protein NTW21_21140 [Verrucomicrobia bacterium]|nr:hypothetical protein [Verrucomicrobiota bacterium]